MSAAGSQAGSDAEDDDPSKLTRADVRALRRLAREAEQRRDREDRKDSERRKFWKTADVGYFWPDMPASYGPGRIVDYDGSRYFRDVNSFVTQLKDSMAYYTAEVVANNIQNCLKGQAFTWYSDILPAPTKRLLRLNTADECKEWTDMLLDAFKLSGSEAMKKISSDNTRYTMQMLKSGVSVVNWFTDMVSLAMDAEFGKDKQILRFIWFKMDAEMREKAPRMTDSHTIPGYLSELRNAEEGIREAVRAQDQRIAAEMRGSQWRAPQSRPYWNKTPTRPYGHMQQEQQPAPRPPTTPRELNSATTPTPNRDFTQYLPAAMKSLEVSNAPTPKVDSGTGSWKNPREWARQRPGPAWNNKVLGPRKDNFRVNPKRTCRFCDGYHYDSMCRQRNLATPRVYCFESDEVPVYIAQPRGDPEYDQEHQDFVTAFFASGNTMDDFYDMCNNWEDSPSDYMVECGLAEAEPVRNLKAPSTTAVYNATARCNERATVWKPTRFPDTAMRVPTPKYSARNTGNSGLTIHHVGNDQPMHSCKRCPAVFRKRNRLFAHLRTSNHYTAADPEPSTAPTPNDATKEHDPEVVKSTAPVTFGTGYGFRTYNYLEMPVRLTKHGTDDWICLDTGAGMSLIDRQWLQDNCPEATILTRATNVSVRGIDNQVQKTSNYVVLQVYIPGHDAADGQIKLAEIRREFHIVPDLRCKMIIGEDIIEPEGIVIDSRDRKARMRACNDFVFKLRITPKGRQILHRRVATRTRVAVAPGARALIPIKCKPLPNDRDCEFTPVYEKHTSYLAEAGGFFRAVVDNRTEAVIFHNRSEQTVVVQKNLRIGYIADFTPESYHACVAFDPDEHPTLFDAAQTGEWNEHCPRAEKIGSLIDDTRAMSNPWTHARWQNGVTDAMHTREETAPNDDRPPADSVDINTADDITEAQADALRRIVQRFAIIFEDRGTVARESEEDHMRIILKPGAQLPNKGPYNNSAKDRDVIDTTFDKYHLEGKMGWARPGRTRGASPAFVVWQQVKGRVVMDVRGLNAAVEKDPYPMPRQEDILQAMKGCHWLTTLDLTAAFMQRALHKDSQHLVTVVTHRGLEYFKVAPFGFTNSPAHMQRFMDGKLRNLKRNVRCYIDDIVIFSKTFEDHLKHLTEVLQILHDAGLYLSPKKCHLAYHSVKLLGRMVDRLGLSTLRERAEAVQKLQFPKTLQQLESFIGAANYNRSHVAYYAALIAPLEQLKRELLRDSPKKGVQRKRFTAKCSLDNPTRAQILSFEGVKNALSGPNTLIHFDNAIPLIVRMDASKERGYGAMITQIPVWSFPEDQKAKTVLDPTAEGYDYNLERPICFLSKRLNKHEMNYWPTELEVAGLVWTVRKVRHLIDDSSEVVVFTDHQATRDIVKQTNFRHSTPHRQNLRLVRASLYLSQFPQIKVLHIAGKLNIIPDALSRLQAIDDATTEETGEDIYDALLLQASMLRVSDDFVDKLQKGYNEDPFYRSKFAEMKRLYAKSGSLPIEYNNLCLEDAELHSFTPQAEGPVLPGSRRYLLYLKEGDKLRLCIPRSMTALFLQMAHDKHNHGGFERTYHKLRQQYFIKGASTVIRDYIQHCPSCLLNKPNKFTPSGRLIPIEAPAVPWELVTMDFVVKLPPCKPKGGLWAQMLGEDRPSYDAFLTVTDKLTKYVILVPGCETWTAEQWAEQYFDKIFPVFGVPAAIISDRGSVFLSQFWTTVFKRMKTDCISTTAYNPRSDGQSERTNQVVEIALRYMVNEHQDDWASYLSEIQFVMNTSPNAATGKTPSDLMLGFMPRAAIEIVAGNASAGKQKSANERIDQMKIARDEAKDAILLANFTMAATYDKNRHLVDIRLGDQVFINFSKRNESGYTAAGIRAPKLGPQRVGPFRVLEMIGTNACRVDIPTDWKIWPVISVRHLTKAPSTPDTFMRATPEPAKPDDEVHEVEEVLDVRVLKGKKEYFVKWIGLPITRCDWVQPGDVEHARQKIEQFDDANAVKAIAGTKRKRNDEKGGRKKK
jgi:predicted nucleic acid-binding Zn ribbon protein